MPPLPLTNLLHTALPHVSQSGRALLSALGCMNGHAPRSGELAAWLGFHDRYQLARALRREGLPPLEVMSGWARTLYWVQKSESSGWSLRALAEREQLDPAVAYRLVHRVTGRCWSEVRREGLATAVLHFRDRCGARARASAAGRADSAIEVPVVSPHEKPRPAASTAVAGTPVTLRPASWPLSQRVYMTGMPYDVTFSAGDHALVTRPHAALVDVLALNPLRIVSSIRVGPTPTRVIASPLGPWAFVTNQFAETVGIIDLARRAQVGIIPVPGHPFGAALTPDGQTLFVVTNQDRLLAISPLRRAIIAATTIPLACPHLAMHPSGHRVFVSCWRAGAVLEVDTRTLAPTRRFDVGGITQDVVVSADGQTLYIANEGGWLDAIHLPSERRRTVQLDAAALGLALSPDNAVLFVSQFRVGRVAGLRRTGLHDGLVIATGGRPQRFAVHGRGTVLVANESGWVDLISDAAPCEDESRTASRSSRRVS
jgi:DNA-binding beta-propeller fold protein YncE